MPGPNSGTRAFLGLGGNIGDPAAAMGAALRALDATKGVAVVAVSSLYRTPPWGRTDQPDFLNAAAGIKTRLSPSDLLGVCLDIERSLKRVRRERWGPRAIDIDILTYGDRAFSRDGLQIPHPRMAERAFVLVPLAEIAPELAINGVAVADLLRAVDASGVKKLPGGNSWWREPPG